MKTKVLLKALWPVLGLFAVIACSKDHDTITPPDNAAYFPKVRTIIQNNCLSCHSSSGSWSGRPIAFDSDSAIAEQYTFIKAAVADPVSFTNKRMPQGGMLLQPDIDIIVAWYNKGGKVTD